MLLFRTGAEEEHGRVVLVIDNLRKSFGPVTALDGCSLRVARGQMLGLLGPNGAGKTTAMRAIFGLVRADGGSITWDGRGIDRAIRRGFGYMPEERGLYPKLAVRWQLAYLGRLHGMKTQTALASVDRWLETFDLTERAEAELRELSHGNQQRVQLIAALLHDPELVVLDEPFSGLDPIGASSMAEILLDLANAGTAVVFSSHQLDVVEDLCRDVTILHRGKVVLAGRVRQLRASSPVRYVDVIGGDQRWLEGLEGAEIVERDDGRARVRFAQADDAVRLAAAVTADQVTQMILEPPPLSEVFRRAVES